MKQQIWIAGSRWITSIWGWRAEFILPPAQDESPSAPLKFLPGKKPCATFQGCVVTEQATMRKTLKCKGSVVTQIRHVSFVIVYVILLTGRRRQAKDRVILAGRTGTLLNKLF